MTDLRVRSGVFCLFVFRLEEMAAKRGAGERGTASSSSDAGVAERKKVKVKRVSGANGVNEERMVEVMSSEEERPVGGRAGVKSRRLLSSDRERESSVRESSSSEEEVRKPGAGKGGKSVSVRESVGREEGSSEGGSDAERAAGLNKVEQARGYRERLRKALGKGGKYSASPEVAGIVFYALDKMVDLLVDSELVNARLVGKLEGRGQIVGQEVERPSRARAEVQAKQVKGEERLSYRAVVTKLQHKSRERPVVVVKQAEGEKKETSQELKARIVRDVKIREEEVQVKEVRLMRDSAVAVEVRNKEQAAKLEKSEQWKTVGLKAERERRKRPQVVIYGVEEGKAEEFCRTAYSMNKVCSKDRTSEDFSRDFRVVKVIGRGERGRDVIVEVEPKLYRALIDRGFLELTWGTSRIRDYVPLDRCFRCGLFGHYGKECSKEKDSCYRCGSQNHRVADCRALVSCGQCRRAGRPADHRMNAEECPIVWGMMRKVIARTDYGR